MKSKIFFLIALLLFVYPLSVLAFDSNVYQEQRAQAVEKISIIKGDIEEMNQSGFTTTRLGDEFEILRQIHENNLFKINNNQLPDFVQFNERYDSIKEIISIAYQAKDELIALNKAVEELAAEIDIAQAKELYLEAEKEFVDERYEFTIKKIDATYEKLIELQGVRAKANAAYEATRKNLSNFLIENRFIIIGAIVIPITIYLIFRKSLKLRKLNKLISDIKFEVNVLKNEIKKAQEIYFVEGTIPEGEYSIKVKLYSDKIRELNRNLALFEEEKEKILNQKKKK